MRLPKRILIIRLGALGDIVHALPVLAPLRQRIPDAHIAWMIEDSWVDLLKDHPLIDDVIAIPKGRWRDGLLRPWRWPDTLSDILTKRRGVAAGSGYESERSTRSSRSSPSQHARSRSR